MVYYISIRNLPSISQQALVELIESIFQANFEFDINCEVVEYLVDTTEQVEVSAILKVDDYYACFCLLNILQGFEWANKIARVQLINNPHDRVDLSYYELYYNQYGTLFPPTFPYQQSRSGSLKRKTYTNPDYILVKGDEYDKAKRVNPCRVFIGNVPYSSNWANLKNFILTKSKEIDSTINLKNLRVEIPIQERQTSDSGVYGNNEVYFESNRRKNHFKSRGFAIVITSNKQSATKLIEIMDNIEFEGRILKVRFDKFPDYNNYRIQQLSSATRNHNYENFLSSNCNYSPSHQNNSVLSKLAFERILLQQNLYYNKFIYPYYTEKCYSHVPNNNQTHGDVSYEHEP
jgi:hypothetical protein